MKNLGLITLLVIVLASCAPVSTALPVSTVTDIPLPTATVTPEPTATVTPNPTATATPSRTPRPTSTPLRDLTPSDVGLPWNPQEVTGQVQIKPCYLFTSKMFHAGDGIYFPRGSSDTEYIVVAPADGTITHAGYINEAIGWEINVKTPYVLDGKPVYYDVVHTSGLVSGLSEGSFVRKGESLAIKKKEHLDPAGLWLVDIAFRNGYRMANATFPDWTGLGYFSYTRLIQDDLAKLTLEQFHIMPNCEGNPIKQNKPYATPTPGGFTYP